MNLFEEAVLYATILHAGKTRKGTKTPYILHPLEVSQIISTMTDDIEIITAGVLHDVVEDTDGTLEEIRARFGSRVAMLVESETENKYFGEAKEESWKKRKEESLLKLKSSTDTGVKILWLADKLSNIRALQRGYSEVGSSVWDRFNQKDASLHKWYYQSIAEILEIELNTTGAFKELIEHINLIWPGTFHADKMHYKKYRELSVEGRKLLGKGAKGSVYRYNDELIVKVYNEKNLFKDIERENQLARKAFVAGIPTAISFGIVRVGNRYGSLFELLDSDTVSNQIAKNPDAVSYYAAVMADLAKQIHTTNGMKMELPNYMETVYSWVDQGVAKEDALAAEKIRNMLDALPVGETIIHGDFHSGNVMAQKQDYLLIDMDTLAICHPIVEISGVYRAYVGLGEIDKSVVEKFLGFSYEVAGAFWKSFLCAYLETEDEAVLHRVEQEAALLAYTRLVRHLYKNEVTLTGENRESCDYYMEKIRNLLGDVNTFAF